MTTPPQTPSGADAGDMAGALDLLLTDAALGPSRRFFPGMSGLRLARALASRPRRVASRIAGLAGELGRVAAGTSTVAPTRRDRRFADPAWTQNPLLRRAVQAYLATGAAAEGIVADVPMEWRDAERIRFVTGNIVEALAPSNNPLLSPVAWKAFIDSGGGNAVAGTRNLLRDMTSSPRVPSMVAPDAFDVGTDLACTAGSVVLRTPVIEVLQYAPQTPVVRSTPLVIIPPTINKFYVLDIAPGRSMVEYLVQQGQQVFVVSWRNPDARHSKWGADVYCQAILDALQAARDITGSESAHLLGACSGGILSSLALAHLAQTGQQHRIAGFTLLVTLLDQAPAGAVGALVDETTAEAAIAASRARGYLDGRKLAEVFAWLRPSDLIWNYWVNNYLQGKTPPAFDILFWNADTTRMTARLHHDFVRMAMTNALTKPGGATVLGTDVDLAKIDVDGYVVAGVADHICPWQSCYRSTQMLGGPNQFVLSTNGHIAALVNPPGNPKASFQTAGADNPADSQEWLGTAKTEQGSWWPHYAAWLADRSGPEKPAPETLGSARYHELGAAPGSYVLDR